MRLNNQVASGRFERAARCELCGSTDSVQGHHRDYKRPLAVQWLCRGCHGTVEGIEDRYAGELLKLSTADRKTNRQRAVAGFR